MKRALLDDMAQTINSVQEYKGTRTELVSVAKNLLAIHKRLKEVDLASAIAEDLYNLRFRTPLTSIRAFSEILQDHPDLDQDKQINFLGIITSENVRFSREIDLLLSPR